MSDPAIWKCTVVYVSDDWPKAGGYIMANTHDLITGCYKVAVMFTRADVWLRDAIRLRLGTAFYTTEVGSNAWTHPLDIRIPDHQPRERRETPPKDPPDKP